MIVIKEKIIRILMKRYFLLFIVIMFSFGVNAQIDSRNKSIAIPAIESETDSIDSSPLLPSKPLNDNTISGMTTPKLSTDLSMPKKEFSMFGEQFGNPGELYEDRMNKITESIKVEEGLGSKGSTTDQYFGDFHTKSQYIRVLYRDFGAEDGDLIQIRVNDDIIQPRVLLTNGPKVFKLNLQPGFNKIDFVALNEGASLPNTAEFRVIDDKGVVITANQWNLSTGVKATIILVKD